MRLLTTALASIVLINIAAADIIYVSSLADNSITGPTQGSSWDKAFSSPQDAFDKSAMTFGPDLIVIAEGVYKADHNVTNPTWMHFNIEDDVTVVGGYRENDDWRNPTGNVFGTVLSAEISSELGHHNNCRNVLMIQNAINVRLQRLKIYGGYGGLIVGQDTSGAILYGGAGICFNNAAPGLQPNRTNFSMKDVWIDQCFSETYGGGLYYAATTGTNSEDDTIFNALRVTITNCSANAAGGGAYVILEEQVPDPEVDSVIQNLSISNCSSGAVAGGLALTASGTDVEIANSQIFNCQASGSQGGFSFTALPWLVHASIKIEFCTIYNNVANNFHSGSTSSSSGSDIAFRSSILWSQGTNIEVYLGGLIPVEMTNCCVRGGIPGNTISSSIITLDPDLSTDLMPREFSPMLDAASTATYPRDWFDLDGDLDTMEAVPYDYVGGLRYRPVLPDIGAHERQ